MMNSRITLLPESPNARRGDAAMPIALQEAVTPQSGFLAATLRDAGIWPAWQRCSLFIWNNQTSLLAPCPAGQIPASQPRIHHG